MNSCMEHRLLYILFLAIGKKKLSNGAQVEDFWSLGYSWLSLCGWATLGQWGSFRGEKSFKMYAQSILNSILPVQDYILPGVGKMTINYVGDIVYILKKCRIERLHFFPLTVGKVEV